ncbi:caspase family protein [Actinomadura macra]|uniref:caspase family protein n=1 Tax=Actinomadura macra TaxID=46164 RepID=UPI00082B53B8|nr:caspase family protein [Actinomadura macra]
MTRAVQPDPALSRVVLIGVARYEHLGELPTVDANLRDLRRVFTDPMLWGLPPANCTVLDSVALNRPDARAAALRAVKRAALEAEDTLVVYYAGHGLTVPDDEHGLYLALPGSAEEDADTDSLPYDVIRRLMRETQAKCTFVILDCCYSGRVLARSMGATATVPRLTIEGACVLTATPPTRQALAPLGRRHTAFTGELLDLWDNGIAGGPVLLDMNTVFPLVHDRLDAAGFPTPDIMNHRLGGHIALVRNRSLESDRVSPEPRPLARPPISRRLDPHETGDRTERVIEPRPPHREHLTPRVRSGLTRGAGRVAVGAALVTGVLVAVSNAGPLLERVRELDIGPFRSAKPVIVDATGKPPWKVEGYGFRYSVEKVTRTSSEWQFKRKPSITITAYATRTRKGSFARMEYRYGNQGSGAALDTVPFQGSGDDEPPLNQPSRLVAVVWDTDPRARHLVVTLHDFYWPGGRDLVLRNIPVGPQT